MSLYTDQKYVGLISPRLDRFKQVRPNLWNSRCPICGDSQKNKAKKRLYIYAKKQDLFVKCHNCGYGASLGNFIKELDPHLHGQYIMERYGEGHRHVVFGKKIKEPEFKFPPPKFKPKKTTIHLPSIGSLPKDHFVRIYYEGRKIPGSFMDKVFFAEDFKKWAQSVCQIDYSNLGKNEPRMVIPFFNENGKLIAAQGRALGQNELRYITVKVHENNPKIYGLDRWKSDKHTYIVEGPIDSMFVPNCLAVAGGDLASYKGEKKNTTLIFDNEPRNFEVAKKTLAALQMGWKVVVWPYGKLKDINEMVLNGTPVDKIMEIINKNTYSGIEGEWEVRNWQRAW
tara:strand:+ start:177 stop:1196 length:1020 start_codon:yes stop_codon:yes gene_type:complete